MKRKLHGGALPKRIGDAAHVEQVIRRHASSGRYRPGRLLMQILFSGRYWDRTFVTSLDRRYRRKLIRRACRLMPSPLTDAAAMPPGERSSTSAKRGSRTGRGCDGKGRGHDDRPGRSGLPRLPRAGTLAVTRHAVGLPPGCPREASSLSETCRRHRTWSGVDVPFPKPNWHVLPTRRTCVDLQRKVDDLDVASHGSCPSGGRHPGPGYVEDFARHPAGGHGGSTTRHREGASDRFIPAPRAAVDHVGRHAPERLDRAGRDAVLEASWTPLTQVQGAGRET